MASSVLARRLFKAAPLTQLTTTNCYLFKSSRLAIDSTARISKRSFSSRPPPRLRFPPGFDSQSPRQDQDRSRPHAIALFPGDYEDDENSLFDSDFYDVSDPADEETDKIIQELKFLEEQDAAKRQRWMENNVPPVRVSEIDDRGRAYGRGGRKTASARVWIQPGFGQVLVNRRPFVDYFSRESDRELVLEPFVMTETCGKFDVTIMVQGGGLTGQAGAASHGAANALNHYNPDRYRYPLKRMGLLTRDDRMVERKVVGRVKARKSPQWVRR